MGELRRIGCRREPAVSLAFAFGMAVTGTITIITLLHFYTAWQRWHVPTRLLALAAAPLLVVDPLFLAANATKIVHGAWLPLVIAVTAFTVMTTWQRGRQIVTARRAEMEGSLQQFVDDLNADPARATVVRGTAIFLNRGAETTPLALRADVEHNHVRREHVAIAATDVDTIPRVPPADRVRIDALRPTDDGTTTCGSVSATPKTPDVPAALSNLNAEQTEGPLDLVEASS